jgi:NAD(P)-dependent dehydrogenase (short-subunit alcohol dehydrogenase family)
MASRNKQKANAAKKTIIDVCPDAKIDIVILDLANSKSILEAAKTITETYEKIDGLVNNAGVMFTPYQLTEDGFEYQNGVNHLGHFLFTKQCYPLLKKTDNSRVVSVSSLAHSFGKFNKDNYLNFTEKNYSKMRSYGLSKLSNLLFTQAFARRLEKNNINILALASHPGVASTGLTKHSSSIFTKIFGIFSQSAYAGAQPTLRALLDPDAKNGQYYGPSGLFKMKGRPVLTKAKKKAYNKEAANALWMLSEQLWHEPFQII